MAHFGSSVSIEASFDKVVAYTSGPEHVQRFVSAVEGRDTVGDVAEWQRLGDRLRHRVEWKADGYRGWLEAHRRGYVAFVAAEVHTTDEQGAQERLERALGVLKADIEAVDAADTELAEASPSFVVETVLKGLIRAIPAAQRGAMAPYLARAADLDGSEALEDARARVCTAWAAGATAGAHGDSIVTGVVEAVEAAETGADTAWLASERELVGGAARAERLDPQSLGGGEVPPGFQHRLNDAYEALKHAHKLAAREGWDAVPWPTLLEQLFAATA